jgi:hypothetical protein
MLPLTNRVLQYGGIPCSIRLNSIVRSIGLSGAGPLIARHCAASDMAVAQLKPKSKQPTSLPFHALSIAFLTVKKAMLQYMRVQAVIFLKA